MNSLGKLFLKGLAVTVPVVLTLAILWWMAAGSERLLGALLTRALPQGWYLPGMGLVAAVALITLVGLLSHVLIFQKLFRFWEHLINRLPLVKTIYTAIKDFIGYFNPDEQQRFSKVVLVQLPGQSFQVIGFVTREVFDDLPFQPAAEDPVAVYCPMSYQIGGYTLFLPRSCLQPLQIPFEEAMRLAVTGGIKQQNNSTD
ncbi:MAG: DUF502 domain-containing protein [Xanthomonadales bacterium]|nr:DUF502 domain-containing protein [Xanthomonadales bacterium]NIN58654.1 DUF502 domain-containing protein [Xanthomonadales bacterium]NIN73949.1 DUF502 domain-containing protein [Xanthomonadales bacterium]NIO14581.1 DUF502 domain-containing protein [Xanthomonadales bacterium]NIP11047.1 DUF502 domain-containing protein [Xanthomonadales bacterium]